MGVLCDWLRAGIFISLCPVYVFIYMLNTDVKRQRYLSEAWFTARLALCPNMAAFNVIIPPHSANTLSRHYYYYYSECKFARDRAAERACAVWERNAHSEKFATERCGQRRRCYEKNSAPFDSIPGGQVRDHSKQFSCLRVRKWPFSNFMASILSY